MRYLKSYELFENVSNLIDNISDDVKETIREILLPMSDMGYNIDIEISSISNRTNLPGKRVWREKVLIVRVVKSSDKPLVINDEIRDDFTRLRDYISSEGFESIKVHCIKLMGKYNRESTHIFDFDTFIVDTLSYTESYQRFSSLVFVIN